MEFPPPKSPLTKGLFFKKRIVNLAFRMLDRCMPRRVPAPLPKSPKKILISHFGNWGDLILSSKAIGALKERFPEAKFGFLVRKEVASLFEGELVHCKAALHCKKEIVKERYEMAIDLHPYFPNGIPQIAEAGIPVRIGYVEGGFGGLLTHPFQWKNYGKYWGELHLDHLGLKGKGFFHLPESVDIPLPREYVVIHMGASHRERDWDRDSWMALIQSLKLDVVLGGSGKKDATECKAVAEATGCINLCDKLSVLEYGAVLRGARLVITVDTLAMHLAALSQVPMIALFLKDNFPHLWFPVYPSARGLFLTPTVDVVLKLAEELCTS